MNDALFGFLLGVGVGVVAGVIPETRAILKESFLHPTRNAVLVFHGRKVEVKAVPRAHRRATSG